jgi:hypothetical protein
MTYRARSLRHHCGTAAASLAVVLGAAMGTAAALAATAAPAEAWGGGTTTTTTSSSASTTGAGTDCRAPLSGAALDRSGWVASTNAHPDASDAPANALDGNLSTRFSTDEFQATNLYFQVDMGRAETFDQVVMESPNSPNDYARGYDVQVSNGSAWTVVAACTGTGTPEVVSFPSQTAQYVAVVLTAPNASWWWSIDEFGLYEAVQTVQQVSPTSTTRPAPKGHWGFGDHGRRGRGRHRGHWGF